MNKKQPFLEEHRTFFLERVVHKDTASLTWQTKSKTLTTAFPPESTMIVQGMWGRVVADGREGGGGEPRWGRSSVSTAC